MEFVFPPESNTLEQFIGKLLFKLLQISDDDHFQAILYCTREQQYLIEQYVKESALSIKFQPLVFEKSPSTKPSPVHFYINNAIEYGCVLTKKVGKSTLQIGSIGSNFFGMVFGKWPKSKAPFHFKKNARIQKFLLQRHASFEGAKVLELFSGGLSMVRGAMDLHIPMDFVELDNAQTSLYADLFPALETMDTLPTFHLNWQHGKRDWEHPEEEIASQTFIDDEAEESDAGEDNDDEEDPVVERSLSSESEPEDNDDDEDSESPTNKGGIRVPKQLGSKQAEGMLEAINISRRD